MATVTADRVRTPPGAVALVVGAWIACVAAQVSGHASWLGHDRLIEGGLPLSVALVAFVAAWQLMIAAMMLPSALPVVRSYAAAASLHARPAAARAAFVGGYFLVWTAFGALAFAGDVAVHRLVDANPWLAERPWLVAGTLLLVAGLAQIVPRTGRHLDLCRHPADAVAPRFRPGPARAFSLGLDHGLTCLGCCWSLMLVMFAAGVASLVWMAALTAVMVYEKAGSQGSRLPRFVGATLVVWGTLVVVHRAGFPV